MSERPIMTIQRYRDDIETIQPDEQESIDGIIKGMSEQTETVEKREGHAVRASHAKSSACVIGEIVVAEGLPPELAQGLFAKPGRYPIAVGKPEGRFLRPSVQPPTRRRLFQPVPDPLRRLCRQARRLSGIA